MNNIGSFNNKLHSIFSNHGKLLLKNYVTLLQNGVQKKEETQKEEEQVKVKVNMQKVNIQM